MILDLAVLLVGWGMAQVVFNGYEAHVAWPRRLMKLVVLCFVFVLVRVYVGRLGFFVGLGVLTAGLLVMHLWWFHRRHGIHWRTAQPRDAYLALIGKGQHGSRGR